MVDSSQFFLQVLNPGTYNLHNLTTLEFTKPTYILSVKSLSTLQDILKVSLTKDLLSNTDPILTSIPIFTAVMFFITAFILLVGYTDFLFTSKNTVIDVDNYILLIKNNVYDQGNIKKYTMLAYYYITTMMKFFISRFFSDQLILITLGCYWVTIFGFFVICAYLTKQSYLQKQFNENYMSILDCMIKINTNVWYIIGYIATNFWHLMTCSLLVKECLDIIVTYKAKDKNKYIKIFKVKVKSSTFLVFMFTVILQIPLFVLKLLHLFLKNSTYQYSRLLSDNKTKSRDLSYSDYVYDLDIMVKWYNLLFNGPSFKNKINLTNRLLKLISWLDFVSIFIISFLIFIPTVYFSYRNLTKMEGLFIESLKKFNTPGNKQTIKRRSYWNDKYNVFEFVYSTAIFVCTFSVLIFKIVESDLLKYIREDITNSSTNYAMINPLSKDPVHMKLIENPILKLIQIPWIPFLIDFFKFLLMKTFVATINDFKKQTNIFKMWYSQVTFDSDVLAHVGIKEEDTETSQSSNVKKSKFKFLNKGSSSDNTTDDKVSTKNTVSFSVESKEKEMLMKSLFNNDMTTMSIFSFTTNKKLMNKQKGGDVAYIKFPNFVKKMYESNKSVIKEDEAEASEDVSLASIHHLIKED